MSTNIWTAASEGDFERVKSLVEGGLSPSVPDENTYTPLHAAASWGHVEILRYLISKGGDINVTDSDGETPLFVVESAEMAMAVVGLGGDPAKKNAEGLTAAESLEEDFPHIALYLRSLTGESAPHPSTDSLPTDVTPDLEAPTDELLVRVRQIMEASERGELSSSETDDKLREVVESAVSGQVAAGREIGQAMEVESSSAVRPRNEDANGDVPDESSGKRRREEPGR